MVFGHSKTCFPRLGAAAGTKALLPEREQVSRGLELLQILREQPQSDSCDSARENFMCDEEEDIDVEVIVKNTFIQVVDPQLRRKMSRSMSDSALLDIVSDRQQQPWQKVSSEKWTIDFSDASTTISKDAEDCQSQDSGCVRKDTCWSDYGDDEMMMQSYMQYGYSDGDGVWWMPMQYEYDPSSTAYDPSSTVLCTMADGSVCPMSMEWMEQGAVDCEGVEAVDSADQEWRTTVMLRNMPNNYTRDMLLELVDSMGFASCYDFAYLPVDFKSQAGLGYAFINFVSSAEAQRCFDNFEGFSGWKVPSEKVCTVTWGSPYQGLEAHIERYQNSPVMHHSIPDEWKPVLIENGVRISFPSPTKPIKTPKVRQQPTAN